MRNGLREILRRVFPGLSTRYRAYSALVANTGSYLHVSGWLESLKRGYPCRPDGSPLPWLNYPVIAFLEARLKSNLALFEYGSGYSTLFYATLVRAVTSVESDETWYRLVRGMIPGNVDLLYRVLDSDGDYCRSIHFKGASYDVVVIDGRDRLNCVKQSLERISDNGVIIFDDSHKPWHEASIRYLKDTGFRALEFEGLKPTERGVDGTAVFYRQENCLDI